MSVCVAGLVMLVTDDGRPRIIAPPAMRTKMMA
jgi:hypothetical protein